MSEDKYEKCKTCGDFHWTGEDCMDLFQVNHPEQGDEWIDVRESYHQGAAMRFGQEYNENGDYALMENSITVLVRKSPGEEIKIFKVSAEPDIDYTAELINQPISDKNEKEKN